MLRQRRYYKGSYITEYQIKILKLLRETESVLETAKKLNIHESTVYSTRKNMEAAIERAIRTLEVAQEFRLLDEDRLAGLMKDVY